MSATLRALHLIDLCTQSISYDRQVQSGCVAFDKQLWETIDDTPVVTFISRILQLADENLIDILAWQFHVDFYDPAQSIEFKRQLVANSIQWHHRKGTVALLQEILDLYWPGGATIIEWFEYMDPLPPNYPTDDFDTNVFSFNVSNIDVALNRFNVTAHGLVNNTQIRFVPALASIAPAPLLVGLWYWVVNATTNTFQISGSMGGVVIDLTDTGTGSSSVFRKGAGTWHDRYRFRVTIDEQIIAPADEAAVMRLINAYKPVSRWLDAFLRATVSACDIGVTGAMLRFIYRESEAPD